MIVEHFIIARDSSIDLDKKTLSIFEIIEELNFKTNGMVAIFPLQMIVVMKRTQERGKIDEKLNVEIHSPKDSPLTIAVPCNITKEQNRTRIRIMVDLQVASSGEYRFKVSGEGFEREASINVTFEREVKH